VRVPAGVFAQGHVADIVETVFDLPVLAGEVREGGRLRGARVEIGDGVDRFGAPGAGAQAAAFAFDAQGLFRVREAEPGLHFADLEQAAFVAAVAGVVRTVGDGYVFQGSWESWWPRRGWLPLTTSR